MAARHQHKLLDAGARAPDFRLARLDGSETSLADITANGPALLAFFKITCPVCQLTFPFLERIHAAGVFPVYGISQNDAADTREFNQRFGVTFPTLLDSAKTNYLASNAYGISSVPTLFLVERDGTISRVTEGWNRKEIEWLGSKAGIRAVRREDNVPEWKAG
ncbi:MAG TPA: TlpA disulfide reductase family protein [Bryobacteraceae bacterium]|jgi:peroxiredoxin